MNCISCNKRCHGRKCRKCYLRDSPHFGIKGSGNHNWKDGIWIHQGYRAIRKPDHPFAKANGYVFEHRLVMEQHIGRYLQHHEIIHHLNGIKTDNRLENLQITDKSTHASDRDHLHPWLPKRKICSLCEDFAIGRGWCRKHYWINFLKAHRANKRKGI